MFTNTPYLLLLAAFLAIYTPAFSKQVPIEQAEQLVKTVVKRNASNSLKQARNLRVIDRFTKAENGVENFYIFNLAPTGFVIISADDRYNAVLAFSDESNIDLSKKEAYVGLWGTLSKHEQRIEYIRKRQLPASLAIQKEWKNLRSGNTAVARNSGVVVAPLTTTRWNQGQYYNGECPANEDTAETGPDGRTYCGCAPIAMAQLIKFHNSPVNGNGSNTYTDPIYGVQTADFCNTQYNWDNMPDELVAPNPDVAKLIYHMGASTYTSYSTDYTSTYVSYIRDAFVNYFGFDQSANWFYDGNGDFTWVAKNDLDRGLPLLLSGESVNGGAHTWVADGYGNFDANGGAGTTEYFHYNWGWGGDNNGWFLDTDGYWFPRGDEPNSDISYYFNRYVVQRLFPAAEGCQAPEEIYISGIDRDAAYLNVQYYSGAQEISFRYRKIGATEWAETSTTNNFFQLVTGLERAAEYEFQARRKCCPSDWSDYTTSKKFVTAGFVPCTPLAVSGMTNSSITDHNAYIYTAQPNGAAVNQFRYRPVGAEEWISTNNSAIYYRYLSNLESGTEYEVQVRQECSQGGFTTYSESMSFTTTGVQEDTGNEGGSDDQPKEENDCIAVAGDNLTISSTSDNNSYIYTPQPLGAVDNQFRYRPIGSSEWIETGISTAHYRYLRGLATGTTYEFQTKQACETNKWSGYSTSSYFTTTGTTPDEDGGNSSEEEDDNTEEEADDVITGNCEPVAISGIYTSSVGNANAYIYTAQPLGAISNQFRYRPIGTTDWLMTNKATIYYRYLRDLIGGTDYEFQTRHECETDNWSEYTASEYFTTTGASTNNKQVITAPIPPALTLDQLAEKKPTIYGNSIANNRIEQSLNAAIKVYPNPASTELFLTITAPISEQTEIRLFDRMGRQVKVIPLAVGEKQVRMDINDLASGIYLLQLKTDKEIRVTKFVKN